MVALDSFCHSLASVLSALGEVFSLVALFRVYLVPFLASPATVSVAPGEDRVAPVAGLEAPVSV